VRERSELSSQVAVEHEELALIYVKRGVEPNLARQVADQLIARDALGAHARDELGISEVTTARPVQAAVTSAGTLAAGAVLPLSVILVSPPSMLVPVVSIASLVFLGLLGAIGARAGGGERPQGNVACRVLGHACDGVDGRYWCSRRYGRLRIGHDHDRGVQALPNPTPSLTAKARRKASCRTRSAG
jgi:hypothetical protein